MSVCVDGVLVDIFGMACIAGVDPVATDAVLETGISPNRELVGVVGTDPTTFPVVDLAVMVSLPDECCHHSW